MSGDLLSQLGRGHGVITASAGTGKTYTLLQLVLREAELGTKLDRILAVTFTRKGTLELRERIRHGLAEAMRGAETDSAARRLGEARRELERATITTIHGFCQQALQERAFEAGQPLDAKLSPGPELASRAFQIALRKGLAGPGRARWEQALEDLGPERLERWLRELLPVLDGLEWESVDWKVVAAAFAGPAFMPSIVAIRDQVRPGASRSAFDRFVAEAGAVCSDLRDPISFRRAVKAWAKHLEAAWFTKLPDEAQRAIREAIASADPSSPLPELARATAVELAELKASEGLVDYGDLIHQLRHALDAPGGGDLAARLAERYDLCLLDEAQDTSEDQWAILWKLFNREGKRLVLVGDAKQAIFGFQGGDLPSFDGARKDLEAEGGQVVSLRENWRAAPAVIEACNAILELGEADSLLIEPGDPVAVFSGADLEPAQPCPEPPSWEGLMPAVIALPVPHRSDAEAAARASAGALADQLLALHAASPLFRTRSEPGGRPFAWRDAFLLVRTGTEADRLASVLRERGVPFVQHKARGLYDDDAAEDLLALLLALEDPSDGSRRMRAFLTPFFGLELEVAERARELPEDHPFHARLRAWKGTPSLDRILDESGVVARLLAKEAGQRRVADLLHLVELLQRAAGPGDGPADHARRLAAWAADEDRPEGEEESTRRLEQAGDAVRILTLHAAKGLEAPVVGFFGGLGAGSDPKRAPLHRYHRAVGDRWERRAWLGRALPDRIKGQARAEAWAELRRLLYVGLTRAQGLILLPVHAAPADGKGTPTFDSAGLPKGPYGLIQKRLLELKDAAPEWLHWGSLELPPREPAREKAASILAPAFPFEAVKARAWTPRTESFTSLQRRMEADDAPDPEPDRAARAEGLPGGTATGVALHSMLEKIPAPDFVSDFRAWWTEDRKAWAEGHCASAGLDTKWAVEAAKLAHAGFSHPLPLPGASPIALGDLRPDRLIRELDFLADAEGGRLTGALDALFEHEGRVFILDWKSNRLPGYGSAELDACMAEDYALQVKVYTLAVLKALGIASEADYEARFGGAVYVFLRGLPQGGVWSDRRPWGEVQQWREALREMLEAAHG